MSRTQALKRRQGKELVRDLASKGILIRAQSMRGAAEQAGLAKRVAFLRPKVCIKG